MKIYHKKSVRLIVSALFFGILAAAVPFLQIAYTENMTALSDIASFDNTDTENTDKDTPDKQNYGQTETRAADVPILLYHHITDKGYGDSAISEALFKEHIEAIKLAGYTTVSLRQLETFVYDGIPLPDKPLCITFDDGYLSNYSIAYPILKQNNMKAAIFVIGWSVGKSFYKDTDIPIIPHFNFAQAKEMLDSGLIEIQSHTFDMHQSPNLETPDSLRESAAPLDDETKAHYKQILTNDFVSFDEMLYSNLGIKTEYFAYPHGLYTNESERILSSLGVKITLSTEFYGANRLAVNKPYGLHAMYRITVTEDMSATDLINTISEIYGTENTNNIDTAAINKQHTETNSIQN